MVRKRERVHIRERVCKDGARTLQLDYCFKGKRYRVSTGHFLVGDPVQDKRVQDLVAEMRNNKENELLQIERGVTLPKFKGDVISVRNFAESLARTKEKKSSQRNYIALAQRIPEGLMLADINRGNFLDILASVCPSKCSMNTRHLYGTIIRAVLNRAFDEGYIESKPNLKGLIPSQQKGNKEFLTKDEIHRLQNVEDEALESTKRMFLFAVNTGLRISDIETLEWQDIVDNRIVKRQVKTERITRIPINENAQALLPPRQDTGLIFPVIPRNTLERRLKALCRKARINKHITFHCARVTCATQLLVRGNDIYTVSQILGHTDIKTTMVYLRLIDDALVKAVDTLDDIGASNTEDIPGENVVSLSAQLKLVRANEIIKQKVAIQEDK